ncbi:MAG: hypothetical protein ABIM62_02300 [candidate division WOR-3 bacterium]
MNVLLISFLLFKSSNIKVEIKGSVHYINGKTYPGMGIYVNYNYLEYFGARGGVEWVKIDDLNQVSVPLEALFYPLKYGKIFSPYLGLGIGGYFLKGENISEITLGYQAFAGFKFNFQKLDAGFEIKYVVPDIGEGKGQWVYSGTIGGGLVLEF